MAHESMHNAHHTHTYTQEHAHMQMHTLTHTRTRAYTHIHVTQRTNTCAEYKTNLIKVTIIRAVEYNKVIRV
jgi:hypothetical protein